MDEFKISEERLEILRKRSLIVVAGIFLLMQVYVAGLLIQGRGTYALATEVCVVLVAVSAALSVRHSLSGQLESVAVSVQEQRLTRRTALGDSSVELGEVRRVVRAVDAYSVFQMEGGCILCD